jgi:inosine-uridine nucleoside N-ribohydrolase
MGGLKAAERPTPVGARKAWLLAAWLLAAWLMAAAPAIAAPKPIAPKLIVYDNDFYGPACTDILPLIGDPDVKVLGFTVVTGDGWLDEETGYLLRFLEVAGRTDIPVVKGALWPLINTPERTAAWERAYGALPWKGAWNAAAPGQSFHPDQPFLVPPNPAGTATIRAQAGTAAAFMIEQVHRHPHQVTILAAGPMTNVALAIRLDPQFASLAKELVFMGALIDVNLPQVVGDTNFNTDFNFNFDPEAAHIALTAPWARIVAVGNVSNGLRMNPALAARIDTTRTPVTDLIARFQDTLPLWDQLAAAIAVDPSLVTRKVQAFMDVDTDHGVYYGATRLWPPATAPGQGEQKVDIVLAVDEDRFLRAFVQAAQFQASQAVSPPPK